MAKQKIRKTVATEKGTKRIAAVRGHKTTKGVKCRADEDHSQFPFFQVYRISRTATLESSMKRAMACKSEFILVKLFATGRNRQRQQLVFTNRRIIVLNIRPSFWSYLWQARGPLDKTPAIGFLLVSILDILSATVDRLLKRARRTAEQLAAVADEDILSLQLGIHKIISGKITATHIAYWEIVEPSLGVTIRRRWFAFHFTKIRGTTCRFIPMGRLRSTASRFLDTADYLLPNQLTVDKVAPVLRALTRHLPPPQINSAETDNSVSVFWPPSIGIGDSRYSVHWANAVTILLAAIALFSLFFLVEATTEKQEWTASMWAVLFGIGALESLAQRRFGEAVTVALTTILLSVSWMITVILSDL